MISSGSSTSHIPGTRPEHAAVVGRCEHDDAAALIAANEDPPDASATSHGAAKIRRLMADRQYFGLDALAFSAGCKRVLARIASAGGQQARVDIRSLGVDFRLDTEASGSLLSELHAGGLLHSGEAGHYRTTALFREYASACVVMPLTRERARTLMDRANQLAARVNAQWRRNPYVIRTVAVSGSFMSRRERLNELTLWLILGPRPQARGPRWRAALSKEDGSRQIGAAMKALSSFVVVRIAADKQRVQRPFTVVFDAGDDAIDSPAAGWRDLWEVSTSFSRRLFFR